jgi:hypothetical protein
MPVVDERAEISEEKREEECTDMSTIDVRIRHDNDTMISETTVVK